MVKYSLFMVKSTEVRGALYFEMVQLYMFIVTKHHRFSSMSILGNVDVAEVKNMYFRDKMLLFGD